MYGFQSSVPTYSSTCFFHRLWILETFSKGGCALVFHSVVGSQSVWVINCLWTVMWNTSNIVMLFPATPTPTCFHKHAWTDNSSGAFLSHGFPTMWPLGCGLCVWLCVARDASHPPGGCAHGPSHPRRGESLSPGAPPTLEVVPVHTFCQFDTKNCW